MERMTADPPVTPVTHSICLGGDKLSFVWWSTNFLWLVFFILLFWEKTDFLWNRGQGSIRKFLFMPMHQICVYIRDFIGKHIFVFCFFKYNQFYPLGPLRISNVAEYFYRIMYLYCIFLRTYLGQAKPPFFYTAFLLFLGYLTCRRPLYGLNMQTRVGLHRILASAMSRRWFIQLTGRINRVTGCSSRLWDSQQM